MSDSGRKKQATAVLTEADVAGWLKGHPDFLQRNPDLLQHLAPPSRFDGDDSGDDASARVVDLQGFMVSRLQADLARAEDVGRGLIDTAHANLASQKQVHDAAIAALSARDLDQFIEIVTETLPRLLELDAAALCVEAGASATTHPGPLTVLEPGTIDALLGDESLLLRAESPAASSLFGARSAPIRSDALVRLNLTGGTPPALFALGSDTEGTFRPEQATDLLVFLTDVLAACLRRWLDLPPG